MRSALSICLHSSFPTAIYWGQDLCLLYNDAWAPIPDDRHPTALGRPAREVWADIWDVIGPQFESVVSTARGYSAYDQLLLIARGSDLCETYWNYSFTPIPGEDGQIAGVFNQGHETTERILGERRLEEESRRQRRMFEQAPGFITILRGPDHTFDFVNQSYKRLFGDRDFIGKTIYEAFPELEGQGFYEWLDRVYHTGQRLVSAETPILLSYPGAPSEQRFLDFIYEPLLDDSGEVTGIFCEGFDVTEAHLARAALTASEAALREESRTLETLNRINAQLAGDLDLQRLVQTVTDAGIELTGARYGAYFHNVVDEDGQKLRLVTLSGASKRDFAHLPPPEPTRLFDPTFENLGVVRSGDISLDPRYQAFAPHYGLPAAGYLPIRSYLAVSVVSRSGQVLGGLFYGHPEADQFTERHEKLMAALAAQAAIAIDNAKLFEETKNANATLEQRVEARTNELLLAHEALRQAQKMEAVGQLTGGIAHDFNNLLAGILGSLELMEKRIAVGRSDDIGRFIKAAHGSAHKAATLTQRLLAFSRRQTLDPKPADVNHLVLNMQDLIRRTVGPSIDISVVQDPALWPTKIDAAQLESALLNLAINARDAMPDGGLMSIETANTDGNDLPRGLRHEGDFVRISVKDTGSGIEPELMDRIFDPFFTTKPIGQGTGLGLSMIHGFVNQSGGHVLAHSVPGSGSTFTLYLPRFLGEIAPEGAVRASASAPVAGQGMVLVIDDDATVRMLMAEALREEGFSVMEATDGMTGLSGLQARPAVDLLITDVGLPGGMNGRQVADAARGIVPRLKVLFVTGYAENAAVGDGHLDTGMAVITKPFAMAHLVLKARDMLKMEVGGLAR
ncbi:ATP-binding protein [Pseudomonas capeferrum]|uniref:ATP-binding protein n=1 Tax=Pseudomonas capeferrum TaxID=1495066 RepID=UPI0035C0BD89